MEEVGNVAALWRYPVKGLAAEPIERATVATFGLAGDRRQALFVENQSHARAGKTYRGKENSGLHLCAAIPQAVALGHARELTLEPRAGGPYFDDSAVSVIFDDWLREAAEFCGMPLDALRFRPNILVCTNASVRGKRERELIGAHLQIGDVELVVTKPIERCVTISYDVATGTPNPIVLETIVRRRENTMGVYCDVLRTGEITAGDAVLLELGASQ